MSELIVYSYSKVKRSSENRIDPLNFQVTYLFSIKKLPLPRYIKEEQR